MIKRLLPYWRGSSAITVVGIVLLILAAGLELLSPWPIKWLIDYVFASGTPPEWWANVAPESAGGRIAAICVALVAIAVVNKAAHLGSQYLLIRAGAEAVRHLRSEVCSHLHQLSLTYHDRNKVGDSIYRAAYDTTAALSLVSQALAPVVTGVIMLVGILIILFRLDWLLTLVAIAVAPIFWFLITGFGKRIEERAAVYHETESGLVSRLQESLSSIRAVQAFSREPETSSIVEAQAGRSLNALKSQVFVQLLFSAAVGLVMALGTAAVVGLGAERVLTGVLSVGDIIVFLAYLGLLYQPINAFSQSTSIIHSAKTQLRRVFEVLDVVPDVTDREDAIMLAPVQGRIEFRDVEFKYEDAQTPSLAAVDLVVEPGQTIALVGPTGAGKTTFTSLLLRFYDPTAGAVLLDGHDLRGLRLSWLRHQVAVVLQDAILFSATIAENIAYARPSATQAEIVEAARRAQADEFIAALPNGYDTVLGERGVNLSGGERQRLAIARAFLKDAPILILDEPTSALDAQTEAALMKAVTDLARGRTTFIISHRLSTVRLADKIVVLEHGRIIEHGTHAELMSGETFYKRLYLTQWDDALAASGPV